MSTGSRFNRDWESWNFLASMSLSLLVSRWRRENGRGRARSFSIETYLDGLDAALVDPPRTHTCIVREQRIAQRARDIIMRYWSTFLCCTVRLARPHPPLTVGGCLAPAFALGPQCNPLCLFRPLTVCTIGHHFIQAAEQREFIHLHGCPHGLEARALIKVFAGG